MFKLSPGGVWRIAKPFETGRPEVVTLKGSVAKRAVYLRLQWMGYGADERLCAVFRDPRTDEVYGQPVPNQPNLKEMDHVDDEPEADDDGAAL